MKSLPLVRLWMKPMQFTSKKTFPLFHTLWEYFCDTFFSVERFQFCDHSFPQLFIKFDSFKQQITPFSLRHTHLPLNLAEVIVVYLQSDSSIHSFTEEELVFTSFTSVSFLWIEGHLTSSRPCDGWQWVHCTNPSGPVARNDRSSYTISPVFFIVVCGYLLSCSCNTFCKLCVHAKVHICFVNSTWIIHTAWWSWAGSLVAWLASYWKEFVLIRFTSCWFQSKNRFNDACCQDSRQPANRRPHTFQMHGRVWYLSTSDWSAPPKRCLVIFIFYHTEFLCCPSNVVYPSHTTILQLTDSFRHFCTSAPSAPSCLSSSLLPSSFVVCLSSCTRRRQTLSKGPKYCCFLVFRRIGEYISLDQVNSFTALPAHRLHVKHDPHVNRK